VKYFKFCLYDIIDDINFLHETMNCGVQNPWQIF